MLEAVLAPKPERRAERREGRSFHLALMRRGTRPPGAAYCGSALRRRIASASAERSCASRSPVAGLGEHFRQRDARDAFDPGHAALGRHRDRRPRLPLRKGGVDFERAEPGAQVVDRGAVPAAQRGAIRLQCLEPVRAASRCPAPSEAAAFIALSQAS